jgi:hypothetical protein
VALLARPGTARWATRDEFDAAVASFRSVANELNEPAIANSVREDAREVTAMWRWPDHPFVEVSLDDSAPPTGWTEEEAETKRSTSARWNVSRRLWYPSLGPTLLEE